MAQGGQSFTICRFDPKKDDLRLFWRGSDGAPLASFEAVAGSLKPGEKLIFGMNGGMYDDANAPVGLYIEHGVEMKRANTRGGAANFHLKPNGVFFVGGGQAGVWETSHFLAGRPAADYATQSGPMLVLNGKIHPRINADGTSAKLRNGVGVDHEGQAVFAISNQPVTFYHFASLFRDKLRLRQRAVSRRLDFRALRARTRPRRFYLADGADRRRGGRREMNRFLSKKPHARP